MGIRVANAPCSWGVLELAAHGAPANVVLSEMQSADYVGTELGDWGFLETDPERLRDQLALNGLELVGGFVPVALAQPDTFEDGLELALRTARLMAAAGTSPYVLLADDNGKVRNRTLNAGRITKEHQLDDTGWAVLGCAANEIARRVREETGLATVFHHHCAGYVETVAEIDRLLDRTDPELLGLCLDTGHLHFGGGDALAVLRRHQKRVRHVHFKDCHAELAAQSRVEGWDYFESVAQGVFCELGKGEVDFVGIVEALNEMGYEGWVVVEQDVLPGMGTPKESAVANRNYLRRLGL